MAPSAPGDQDVLTDRKLRPNFARHVLTLPRLARQKDGRGFGLSAERTLLSQPSRFTFKFKTRSGISFLSELGLISGGIQWKFMSD